jgi:hypothetical protein
LARRKKDLFSSGVSVAKMFCKLKVISPMIAPVRSSSSSEGMFSARGTVACADAQTDVIAATINIAAAASIAANRWPMNRVTGALTHALKRAAYRPAAA